MPPNLKEIAANEALRINSLAIANSFANEMAKVSFSLLKALANGRLRQTPLAIGILRMRWLGALRGESKAGAGRGWVIERKKERGVEVLLCGMRTRGS